jgi:DNA-binding protein HU-beta
VVSSVNKKEFVELLSSELKSTKTEADKVLTTTLKSINEALKKHTELKFIGFGTFKVKSRAAREVRNPQDGKTIKVPKKNYVSFTPGSELKASAGHNKLK